MKESCFSSYSEWRRTILVPLGHPISVIVIVVVVVVLNNR